ncbi:Putative, 10TM heavy-metal exporter [Halolactibacillus halophilus]|uniref:Putative, 10TM heavy-metal exporter n=1 Tax=Halolactibacillus halophilus TaxID=306540 RepID=A0A1I5NMW8_9BACI|nr:putative manganese transporter [Halolactibacillus halophilus]GEM01372.1 hypothetical protein HHA03_09040 [Halolactibacillus halophilus]SFP22666.1 Putative, 10TM heavy-metal exporter [Halolactibacillus halophilus]
MTFDLWTFLLENLGAAGVIGGYISISIIGVSFITFATKGKLSGNKQLGPDWAHPVIGALLGAIPGCGATIIVSSMYKNQKISLGGLVATFIATLGEGSFVLLGASDEASVTANLSAFVFVNVIGIIVALISGYLIDAFGIRFSTREIPAPHLEERCHSKQVTRVVHRFIEQIGFYIIIAMAIFLLPGSIAAFWGGEIAGYDDVAEWVAVALTAFSILYFFVYKFSYKGHNCACNSSAKSTLLHAVSDIATVIVYVFIGLFIANYIIDVVVGVETFDMWMTSSAFIVVIIAAIIGATPGCGGMISVTVAFTTINNFPIAALVAAAIATSGDGIFPLFAANKKDALLITGLSLVIALIVGYVLLALGIQL